MAYHIARGKWANLGAFFTTQNAIGTHYREPWVQESISTELLSVFSGWESELQDVLKVSPSFFYALCHFQQLKLRQDIDKPSRWAIHQLLPLPNYTLGPVVLLGDAVSCI